MRGEVMREIIGWGSAFVLIPTFGLQAYKQWQNRHEHAPASALWFFILALVGVVGQVVYSWMLGNWVYFVLNACLVVTNTLGLALAIHRRGITDTRSQSETSNRKVGQDEAKRPSEAR
jgi:hypothetical protein